MKTLKHLLKLTPVAAVCALPLAALATDGYFANGYGMKSIGMGGAAVALALEPFGGAVNPGAMSFLDSEWQVGLSWFSPKRSASRTGSGIPDGTPTGGWGIDGSVDSDSTDFFIPELAMNWRLSPDLAVGFSVFGNGGMNTDYEGGQISPASACAGFNPKPGPYNLMCGNGRLGVDLMQLMIAPYASWQVTKGHSIGIAPVIAYQRFKGEGLQGFANPLDSGFPAFSTNPGSVTNNGYSDAWGAGVRIGYMGEFTKQFSVGAAYATKISMGEFDGYKGLFAEGGAFDIPSNFTLGAAVRNDDGWLLALDYERIFYSDSKSVSNPSALIFNCAGGDSTACLGGSNGAGFGWHDINVWKVGIQYELNAQWTLRGGFNYTENPIRPQDVTFNILAPGVVQDQWTFGTTWKLDKESELTAAFMYAQNNSVTGTSLLVGFGAPPTTSETIQMKQYQLGIAYSRKF